MLTSASIRVIFRRLAPGCVRIQERAGWGLGGLGDGDVGYGFGCSAVSGSSCEAQKRSVDGKPVWADGLNLGQEEEERPYGYGTARVAAEGEAAVSGLGKYSDSLMLIPPLGSSKTPAGRAYADFGWPQELHGWVFKGPISRPVLVLSFTCGL